MIDPIQAFHVNHRYSTNNMSPKFDTLTTQGGEEIQDEQMTKPIGKETVLSECLKSSGEDF
jgi:hypothetical protein